MELIPISRTPDGSRETDGRRPSAAGHCRPLGGPKEALETNPLLMAPPDAKPTGDWSMVRRDDGSRQWAYRGKSLYHWTRDTGAGDRTGDGFNDVWKLAKP